MAKAPGEASVTTDHQTEPQVASATDQTPTTTDHPCSQTNGDSLSAPQRQRRAYIRSLHDRGGFLLTCQSLVHLYRISVTQSSSDTPATWEREGEGEEGEGRFLTLFSQKEGLTLLFHDFDSGEETHNFKFHTSASRYYVLSPHFHCFVSSSSSEKGGVVWGVSFADVAMATKVARILSHLFLLGEAGETVAGGNEATPSTAKRVKVDQPEGDKYTQWVVINSGDVPPISATNESQEGVSEETDFSLLSRKKAEEKGLKIDEVSDAGYFRHLTQSPDKAIGSTVNLAPSLPTQGAESETTPTKKWVEPGGDESAEQGTTRSYSFLEFTSGLHPILIGPHSRHSASLQPIPVAPPIAPSLSPSSSSTGLTSSSSFASSFSGSSVELPQPPAQESSHETLISQINTFDRKNLRCVQKLSSSAAEEEGGYESVLGSILRNGFDRMFPRLQEKFGALTVASINFEGEEEGFDDFDGTIFE